MSSGVKLKMSAEVSKTLPQDQDAWKEHILAKQVEFRALKAAVYYLKSMQSWRTFESIRLSGENPALFEGGSSRYYSPDTVMGRSMRSLFLPGRFKGNLTPAQIKELHHSADPYGSISSTLMMTANVVNGYENWEAFNKCMDDENCSALKAGVMAGETAGAVSFIASRATYAAGFRQTAGLSASSQMDDVLLLEVKNRQLAIFRMGKMLAFPAFGLQGAAGALKLGIEAGHYFEDPNTVDLSVVKDGAYDLGQSVAQLPIIVHQLRIANIAKQTAGVFSAVDVLSTNAFRPALYLLRLAQGVNVTFAVAGGIPSVISLGSGAIDSSLPNDVRRHRIISGTLGTTGAVALVIAAIPLFGPEASVGYLALSVGFGLITAQTGFILLDGKIKIKIVKDEGKHETVYVPTFFPLLPPPTGCPILLPSALATLYPSAWLYVQPTQSAK